MSKRQHFRLKHALVDRGANGCIIGDDMRRIRSLGRYTSLVGVHDHTVPDLELVQAAAFVQTQRGPIILVVNQGAHLRGSKTILSPGQMEHYGWTVLERSPVLTGSTPVAISLEGYHIPMLYRNGLAHLQLRPPTDDELDTLPHIFATSPHTWDPRCLDAGIPADWHTPRPTDNDYFDSSPFDAFGEPPPNDAFTRSHVAAFALDAYATTRSQAQRRSRRPTPSRLMKSEKAKVRMVVTQGK